MRAPARGAAALLPLLVACGCGAPSGRPRPGYDEPGAALRYAQARRAPLDPSINVVRAYARAGAQRDQMNRFASRIGRSLPFAITPNNVLDAWTNLGPGNIGGRTRVIRYHPAVKTRLFAAGVSGGVWRSDDDGGTWKPTGDGLSNLSVNSLAIDPRSPDTMYAGTGEGYLREDVRGTGLPLRGSGIFVTRDGGSTWQRLESTTNDDFLWVNDLELGIGDSRRIYAATRTGVWRSLDAGGSWTQLLGVTVRGGCLDLAIRPDQTNDTLFASCGTYEQGTVYRFANASGSTSPQVVLEQPSMGRTTIAIAPSRPDVMYALAASNDAGPNGRYQQGLLALYRSDSGGTAGSWSARVTNTDPVRLNTLLLTNQATAMSDICFPGSGSPGEYTNMGWYNNVVAVDPRDPERVWAAGVSWMRSDDGGRTWGMASLQQGGPESANGTHVDQHAIVFHPDYDGAGNQIVIVGNDGGLARTANARGRVSGGARGYCDAQTGLQITWTSLNHGYGVTQFYHGLPFPDGEHYMGGAQDNSTLIGGDDNGANGWRSVIGGDGGYVAINPANPLTMYGEYQWASLNKSTDGGKTFRMVTDGLDPIRSSLYDGDANYLFVAPLAMDRADPNRLWVGGEFLYRSTNGTTWTKSSELLPDSGRASTIAISPADSNRVVAGTHKGDIVSTRAGLTATAATAWDVTRPRDGWVSSVAFDPKNPTTLYATYGNFGGKHVYRSTNDGATWTSTDGPDGDSTRSLPDIPAHSIVVDPDDPARLYVGTDAGVFVSLDAGATWMVEETSFGPAVTEWLSIVRDTKGRKRLFAFTHGRGVWRVDLR